MRIVVVEDEIRIREGICKLIGKMFPQHEVAGSAANGEEGLALILEEQADLVITDVKMPVMDGLTMLSVLSQKKVKCKAIVLSAYADFSYAQQAIRWGVSEYLVKPLVVNEFVQSIKNMEMQLDEAEKQNLNLLEKVENILFGLILGSIVPDDKLISFLDSKFSIKEDSKFHEVQVYLGEHYTEKKTKLIHELETILSKKKNLKFHVLEMQKDRLLLVILYGYDEQQAIERWFQTEVITQLHHRGVSENSYGWINADGLSELKINYLKLLQYMDWNITFHNEVIISYPKIRNVQTVLCIYPIDIENRLKIALCSYDRMKVHQCLEQFNNYFDSSNVYSPKNIKEGYVRFLWAMMNVAKEIGLLNYEHLEQQKILEKIMSAVNKKELWNVTEEIYSYIKEEKREEKTDLSLNVKRAESIIVEYYKTGITLDEIAAKLNLTPEYLGMQFHKEKGVKFSTYIKEYRITKAKELLIGSQMKVCEIAEKIGYSDSKYFSRVFRESTGQLPAEYRKTNK
jgi:Response regulator containing CheY-like receiver domain and AraC-type DNA-binding domain